MGLPRHGFTLSGTLTLQKDVYLVNNNRWSGSEFANGAVILVQSGGISGTGNVNYSGIGSATFSGVDSYTGATNVSGGGCLTISGTSNTNTGNFNVSGGDLFVASSASLGNWPTR